jgi:ribosomal protein L37AE/L43A
MRARDADGTLMWVCARCGRTWPRTAYGKAGTSKDDDPNDYDEGFA